MSAAKASVNNAGDSILVKDKDPGQREGSDHGVSKIPCTSERSFSVAELRKNMCTYLKNQGGYKQSHFKGMSYEDIRPIFESAWDQNHAFVLKDSEIEKEVMKRPGFDLQQESIKKNKKIEALVISDSEEIISVIPLAVKSPIVNLKPCSKGDGVTMRYLRSWKLS
ncbi:hypothetical protein Tco_0092403 [Tanacetum coccineum]